MFLESYYYLRNRLRSMSTRRLMVLSSLFVLTVSIVVRSMGQPSSTCRTIPGDASWPSRADWGAFNNTIGGRLIGTVPIAAPCHRTLFSSANPRYNEDQCDALRNVWFLPETHLPSPSSPMAYQFSNNSCNPWLGPDTPCTIGNHPVYTVDATDASHFQKTIRFAKKNNIRLVVRNTGHDYLGKSTGAHALAIWTHHIKTLNLIPEYRAAGQDYSGPAITVGAGVEAIEAYTFASTHGLMVVGGNCPTVGLAGGFTQGGGHGPLISKYGLSADQVLEWEVVTAAGDLVTASPTRHPDLFWALRGGGGSTFGVVVSVTVKAYPDTYFSTAYMTVLNNGTNADALYEGVGDFIQNLPDLVDAGAFAVWVAAPFGFMLMPALAPDLHQAELDELLKPTRDSFDALGLQYTYNSFEKPTFLQNYNSLTSSWNVSDYNTGGRLIPRSLLKTNPEGLLDAVRFISSQTIMSGVTFNVADAVASPDDVAVNPYFRKSILSITIGTTLNYTDWNAEIAAQNQITHVLIPKLAALTPDGAAYLNEADAQAPDFKTLFYGSHYKTLDKIKAKYDPTDLFYAKTAVGSDRWSQDADGRLCKA